MGDTRTDSGQFYPGGLVIARRDVAPPQIVVQWNDVQGKPQIEQLPERYRDSDLKTKINEIASKFSMMIVAALIGWSAVADITVQKKRKDQIYNDEQIVVDVYGDGVGMNTQTVKTIINAEVGGTNAVKEAVARIPEITDALAAKRDKTDLHFSYLCRGFPPTEDERRSVVWRVEYDGSTHTFEYDNSDGVDKWILDDGYHKFLRGDPNWYCVFYVDGVFYTNLAVPWGPGEYDLEADDGSGDTIHISVIGQYFARQGVDAPEDGDDLALVSQLPASDELLTAEQRAAIADVPNKLAKSDVVNPDASATAGQAADAKATHDALAKKADEFTEWVCSRPGITLKWAPDIMFGAPEGWIPQGGESGAILGNKESVELSWTSEQVSSGIPFTALRNRVLHTGEAATPQELADAISTNNPAFVSAVRNTPPDDETPWGEYGTVGAAIAGLVALVALMAKRSAFAPEYSATSAYAVGDYVWHDGNIYQCKTEIASPGEAWTAAHWAGPQKLDDFFSKYDSSKSLKNSLLQTAIATMTKTDAESTATATNVVTLNDNAPMTVTVATATADALAVTFANARQAGGLRICELYILNGTADTDITFDAAVQFVCAGDSFPACEAGINYFVFSEVAANLWKVTRETLKSITTPTPVAAA